MDLVNRLPSLALAALLVAACAGSSAPAGAASPTASVADASPSVGDESPFPVDRFAAISESPLPAPMAARLQEVLAGIPPWSARDTAVSATLMSRRGTWSGVVGKASGDRDATITDQFSIASTTKAITAAQVMQLVEQRRLGLDDLARDHVPADLHFDLNGATIRDLLGHRSGLPDYADAVSDAFTNDPQRMWTPAELLAVIPPDRKPAGAESEYANVNYLLLGLVIEEVTGRPVVDVLRDGVLHMDGVDRLIYQPDERPTMPIAIEASASMDVFEQRGGYLPSLALTSDRTAAAMASDAPSLARWWRALCAGEIVSQATLTEMLPTDDWYGLGLGHFDPPGTVGHYGEDANGVSLVGCVPDDGIVYVVLANRNGSFVPQASAGRLIRVLQEQP